MDMPENYVREAGSFIVDNSLFRQRDIMRCLCGYTGERHNEWLHFRAVAVHNEHYKPEQLTNKKLEPPVNGVRIYVCPRCGTAKMSVYEVEKGFLLNRHPLDLGYAKSKKRKQPPQKVGGKK